jgi:sigma-E factor negative regulatory protein RseA
MADNLDEKVSALVDGELPREEIDSLFNQLKRDKTSQACWRHYHLISDALKNNLPDRLPEDFVSRVSQALESEPHLASPPRRPVKAHAFHRPSIGFALAASVAAVAFVGLGWNNQTAVDQSPSLAMNVAPMTISAPPAVSYTKVHGRQWDVEQPAVISKLNGYLLSHDQYSSMAVVRNGVLPQVRIVGYERPENIQQDPVVTDNGR